MFGFGLLVGSRIFGLIPMAKFPIEEKIDEVYGKVGTIVKNVTATKKNDTLYDRVLSNGYASSKELDILKRSTLE
jgi:hypothetical protein